MEFDTKIAVVLRDDLAVWQKTNVTAFLVSGIAGDDDPLKTGNVVCGNEFVHAELVKILAPLAT